MNYRNLSRWLLTTMIASPILSPMASAQIESVHCLTAVPSRYEPAAFVVMLTAQWTSPYETQSVQLDLCLKSPSGADVVVPAYYESGEAGSLSRWMARFAPLEDGTYEGTFILKTSTGQHRSAPIAFEVAHSDSKGFLHPANNWCFRYDDGTPFRGLGQNIGWEFRNNDDSRFFKALHENPRYNYEYMLGNLASNGGNFFRTWMCAWNLPLEWNTIINTDRYTASTQRFNQSAIQRMDELVQLCDALDIHMMLTLDHAGSYIGGEWAINSYNVANGGPAASPEDFFRNPAARQRYKDRLRYIIARWGYSPAIGAWEFWNEVDNAMYAATPQIPDALVTDWHREMADYLKHTDPAHRLVTTSVSHRDVEGLNDIQSIDFNQRHIYKATNAIPDTVRKYSAQHGKPYVIGEFSYEWDWSKDFNSFADEMDRDFKDGLWLGLFAPTPVLPMTWWWEFFDARNLTPYYQNVRTVQDLMLEAGNGRFEQAEASWTSPEIEVMGVRCGSTPGSAKRFYYLANGTGKQTTGTLRIPLENGWEPGEVTLFDTRTGQFSPANNYQVTDNRLDVHPPSDSHLIIVTERAAIDAKQ